MVVCCERDVRVGWDRVRWWGVWLVEELGSN